MDGKKFEFETELSEMSGLVSWGCRYEESGFFSIDFGDPNLSVRDVTKHLRHRNVLIYGDYHLWVNYALWEISGGTGSLLLTNPILENRKSEKLNQINGQYIEYCKFNKEGWMIEIQFDLGAVLKIYKNDSTSAEDIAFVLFTRKSSWTVLNSGLIEWSNSTLR